MWLRRIGMPPLWPSRLKAALRAVGLALLLLEKKAAEDKEFERRLVCYDALYGTIYAEYDPETHKERIFGSHVKEYMEMLDEEEKAELKKRHEAQVSIMCALQTGFIYSFTTYLQQADVDYLDLSYPKRENTKCFMVQPECRDTPNPLGCLLDRNELLFGAVHLDTATAGACPVNSSNTCREFALPMKSIHGDLGSLHTINRWVNPLRLWAFLFALLTATFIGSIALHDQALIMAWCRPSILSLRSLQRESPMWWACAACVQFTGCMDMLRKRCRGLWLVLLPFWWVYRLVAFVFLVFPITLLAALMRPVGFARLMVFSTGFLCMICSLLFDFSILLYERDMYALFWNADQLAQGCICLCEYPLSGSVVIRLVFLGFVVFAGSFSVSFRALKGLRRANWGNLFSVLYAVPVEVFPVVWERPKEAGGGPITFRKPGEEVQGEPAFDPFCLMDEQPESGRSCARLQPEPQSEEQQDRWLKITPEAEIGCCGIPLPRAKRSNSDAELEEVAVEDAAAGESDADAKHVDVGGVAAGGPSGDGQPQPPPAPEPVKGLACEGDGDGQPTPPPAPAAEAPAAPGRGAKAPKLPEVTSNRTLLSI